MTFFWNGGDFPEGNLHARGGIIRIPSNTAILCDFLNFFSDSWSNSERYSSEKLHFSEYFIFYRTAKCLSWLFDDSIKSYSSFWTQHREMVVRTGSGFDICQYYRVAVQKSHSVDLMLAVSMIRVFLQNDRINFHSFSCWWDYFQHFWINYWKMCKHYL